MKNFGFFIIYRFSVLVNPIFGVLVNEFALKFLGILTLTQKGRPVFVQNSKTGAKNTFGQIA